MAFLYYAELGKTVLGKPALGVYMFVLYRTVQYHKLTLTLWVGGRRAADVVCLCVAAGSLSTGD